VKLTPKQLDKNLGTTLWGGIIVLQFLLLLSYLGSVGLSLGLGEAILWLLGGLVLLNESVVENGNALAKLKVFPLVSFLGGVVALVFGVGLMGSMVGITSIFLPMKVYLLVAVWALEIIEAYKKG
jgi:hypothetical protein